jgi:hypothetical protein
VRAISFLALLMVWEVLSKHWGFYEKPKSDFGLQLFLLTFLVLDIWEIRNTKQEDK